MLVLLRNCENKGLVSSRSRQIAGNLAGRQVPVLVLSRQFRDKAGLGLAMLLSVALLGCGPAADNANRPGQTATHDHDHDHGDAHAHGDEGHDHDAHAGEQSQPEGFPAAVAAVRQHYEVIRDAFQANDMDKAHEPLHSIGHLIETLPELAAKAELGEQDLATVKSAAAAMFAAYGEIDDAIHTGKEADYASASGALDKAMADLQAVLEAVANKAKE